MKKKLHLSKKLILGKEVIGDLNYLTGGGSRSITGMHTVHACGCIYPPTVIGCIPPADTRVSYCIFCV